ncbi:hypothetical protein BJ508DRAFT_367109 [Ascobolus immersus RN42]|uniref:Uncharacterized protein n=1 Tax=Ascobolus immersus RN42 TaxID=1160509 RepID=A0A3N4HGR6_ASCIM|nr:hypothetical protein BJ508DRAFT_367109 [Ascobolus immersus RN42]
MYHLNPRKPASDLDELTKPYAWNDLKRGFRTVIGGKTVLAKDECTWERVSQTAKYATGSDLNHTLNEAFTGDKFMLCAGGFEGYNDRALESYNSASVAQSDIDWLKTTEVGHIVAWDPRSQKLEKVFSLDKFAADFSGNTLVLTRKDIDTTSPPQVHVFRMSQKGSRAMSKFISQSDVVRHRLLVATTNCKKTSAEAPPSLDPVKTGPTLAELLENVDFKTSSIEKESSFPSSAGTTITMDPSAAAAQRPPQNHHEGYQQEVHLQIERRLRSGNFDFLPTYTEEELANALENVGATIIQIAKGEFDENPDPNFGMVRLALAIAKEKSLSAVGRFPIISLADIQGSIETVLRIMVARFGLKNRPHHNHGAFYCAMLYIVNVLTDDRICLEKLPPSQVTEPSGTYVTGFKTIQHNGNHASLIFENDWIPRQMLCGPAPEDDHMFQSVIKATEKLALDTRTRCGLTEYDFGYGNIRIRVPVLYSPDQGHANLLEKYFYDTLVVHITATPSAGMSSDDAPIETTTANQPVPFLDPIPEENVLAHAERLLLSEYKPPAPVNGEPEKERQRKLRFSISRYWSNLKVKAANKRVEGIDKDCKRVLYHGAPIGKNGVFNRGSFCCYVNSKGPSPSSFGPYARFFITTGHVAPDGTELVSPSRLDTGKALGDMYFSDGSMSAPRWSGYSEAKVLEVLNREIPVGRSFYSVMGAAVDSDEKGIKEFVERPTPKTISGVDSFTWRKDYALCVSYLEEEARNGFSEVFELLGSEIIDMIRNRRPDLAATTDEELLEVLNRVQATEDAIRGANEFVFKNGATTGLTAGQVNGREFYDFLIGTDNFAPEGTTKVDRCLFDLIYGYSNDKEVGDNGDSGSGVFKLVWRGGKLVLAWCGLLASLWHQDKGDPLGMMIPANAVLAGIKSDMNMEMSCAE